MTFMAISLDENEMVAARSAAPFASLAAVFPDVRGERAQGLVVGGVIDEGAFAPGLNEACAREALQVVAQRGGGQIEMVLDVAGGRAFGFALDDVTQDGEPRGLAQRAEFFGVAVELRGHDAGSKKVEECGNGLFRKSTNYS